MQRRWGRVKTSSVHETNCSHDIIIKFYTKRQLQTVAGRRVMTMNIGNRDAEADSLSNISSFMPNGCSDLNKLDQSIAHLSNARYIFYAFILNQNVYRHCKQWRP